MGYYDDEFDDIKGKKILDVIWTCDTLTFRLAKGELVKFNAYGACCSISYIESIDAPEVLKGATLLDVEAVDGESKEIEGEHYGSETHKWTFYKFKTDKGMCTLSFRNESNGYYDGHLERDRSTDGGTTS